VRCAQTHERRHEDDAARVRNGAGQGFNRRPGVGQSKQLSGPLDGAAGGRDVAFQVRDVFDAMQADAGTPLSTLLADGGASRNDLLMQIQADTIGCPVERSRSSDVSALGAALLAGLAIGLWKDEGALEALIPARDRFEPQIADAEREARYAGWRGALARALLAP